MKPFYSQSYKDSDVKASTATNLVNRSGMDSPKFDLDVLDYKNDNHHTLENERSKMASTFQNPTTGENFLPQVVAHSSSNQAFMNKT